MSVNDTEQELAELLAAKRELSASRPVDAAESVVHLAELRRRQGRLSEAAALLHQVHAHPSHVPPNRLVIRAPFVLGDLAVLNALLAEAGIRDAIVATQPGTARYPSIEAMMYTTRTQRKHDFDRYPSKPCLYSFASLR
jgi:hypothetical protein